MTINIFVLKGDLNGKIVVVRFFFFGYSKLLSLRPKLDDDSVMPCDGRLKHAEFLSYNVSHPIILPRKHHVTRLIVKHFHEIGNHVSGTNQILSALSARFWIIAGREEIRDWERKCAKFP